MKDLYIVTVTYRDKYTGEFETYISSVPLHAIKKSSLLDKALGSGECAYSNGNGIEGVYWKRKYAEEHVRICRKIIKKRAHDTSRLKITKI